MSVSAPIHHPHIVSLLSFLQITGRLEEYNAAVGDLCVSDTQLEDLADNPPGTTHMRDSSSIMLK